MAHRRGLLEAADAYRHDSEPENRLTEIFAEVLETAPELARWIAARAFDADDRTAESWTADDGYVVRTQSRFDTGEQPDMRVEFVGPDQPPGALFIENKIHAGWTRWQELGYPSVQGKVLVVSPKGRTPPGGDPRLVPVRWIEVARAADRIGRRWARPSPDKWRELAMSPEAPGQARLLAEFVGYLEREDVDVIVPGPLTTEDIEIVPRAVITVDRWNALFALVAERFGDLTDERPERWDTDQPARKEGFTGWSLRLGTDVPWPALEQLNLTWTLRELLLASEATWIPRSAVGPAFGVGISISTKAGWPSGLQPGGSLRLAIEKTPRITLGMTWKGTVGRIFATLPLREVASHENLDAQAEAVVAWARDQLDLITSIGIVD